MSTNTPARPFWRRVLGSWQGEVLLAILGVALGGWAINHWGGGGRPSQSSAEARVKAFILERANDPGSVQWAEWGPHLMRDEIDAWRARKGLPPLGNQVLDDSPLLPGPALRQWQSDLEGMLRVSYRAKNSQGQLQFYDEFYLLKAGHVSGPQPNPMGAAWKQRLLEGAD